MYLKLYISSSFYVWKVHEWDKYTPVMLRGGSTPSFTEETLSRRTPPYFHSAEAQMYQQFSGGHNIWTVNLCLQESLKKILSTVDCLQSTSSSEVIDYCSKYSNEYKPSEISDSHKSSVLSVCHFWTTLSIHFYCVQLQWPQDSQKAEYLFLPLCKTLSILSFLLEVQAVIHSRLILAFFLSQIHAMPKSNIKSASSGMKSDTSYSHLKFYSVGAGDCWENKARIRNQIS